MPKSGETPLHIPSLTPAEVGMMGRRLEEYADAIPAPLAGDLVRVALQAKMRAASGRPKETIPCPDCGNHQVDATLHKMQEMIEGADEQTLQTLGAFFNLATQIITTVMHMISKKIIEAHPEMNKSKEELSEILGLPLEILEDLTDIPEINEILNQLARQVESGGDRLELSDDNPFDWEKGFDSDGDDEDPK